LKNLNNHTKVIEVSSKKKVIAMASGRGSNFSAVVDAVKSGRIPNIEIISLITDRKNTGAEETARANGIPVHVIECKSFTERREFDSVVEKTVNTLAPDLILTLGYMRIIHPNTVKRYTNKIINIHPSLLPAFPGMNSQKQAFDYGVRVSGATVHFMDEGMDTGPVILQSPVMIDQSMSLDDVKESILKEEHRILTEAVALFCMDKIRMEGRKVIINKVTETSKSN
jgi:phosphoribosylglycinamide formyltransferase 1